MAIQMLDCVGLKCPQPTLKVTVMATKMKPGEILDVVTARWADFDFLFLHVKQTDQAGEDGNLAAKIAAGKFVEAKSLTTETKSAPDGALSGF